MTARSCQLELLQQEVQLERLRGQLERGAGSALSLQLRLLTVRENSARLEQWAGRVREVLGDGEPSEQRRAELEVSGRPSDGTGSPPGLLTGICLSL